MFFVCFVLRIKGWVGKENRGLNLETNAKIFKCVGFGFFFFLGGG